METILKVGGDLSISDNNILSGLAGLNNINIIEGNLWIEDNENLTNLLVLNNLSSIDGALHIEGNIALTNLWGLENIDPGSITDLIIFDNTSLSACDVQSICEYLASPGGIIQIYDNAPGCDNQEELEQACEGHCLYDGISFSTQEQIDIFQTNYPGCYQIEGDVGIIGNDIVNLDGLNNLTYIGGNLSIGSFSPGGGNPSLSDLSGLSSLGTIEADLFIEFNFVLSDLDGLDSLSEINGALKIRANPLLTSLAALKIINPGSIASITVAQNPSLSDCAVESVCSYLASPNAIVNIYNNAPGCNSQQQVQDACDGVSIKELSKENPFIISPNPLESTTLIEYNLKNNSQVTLKILDLSGREIITLVDELQQEGEQRIVFNTDGLKPGIYFCVLKTNGGVQTNKIIKLN